MGLASELRYGYSPARPGQPVSETPGSVGAMVARYPGVVCQGGNGSGLWGPGRPLTWAPSILCAKAAPLAGVRLPTCGACGAHAGLEGFLSNQWVGCCVQVASTPSALCSGTPLLFSFPLNAPPSRRVDSAGRSAAAGGPSGVVPRQSSVACKSRVVHCCPADGSRCIIDLCLTPIRRRHPAWPSAPQGRGSPLSNAPFFFFYRHS